MNTENPETNFTSSTHMPSASVNGNAKVHRVAQKAHEAVDKIEQSIGSSSEKVLSWQQEYGDMCREQVRANPLATVGGAFVAGIIFSKIFLR